ncbi:hypothetical protein V8F20_006041 [Naviculisporaceae sp. PSN 640]
MRGEPTSAGKMSSPAIQRPTGKPTQDNLSQKLFFLLSNPNIAEDDIIAFFRLAFPSGTPEITSNPAWLTTDQQGDTFLHKAVKTFKPRVIKHLLSQNPGLAQMKNYQRFTPLQALEDIMDSIRHPFLGDFYTGPPFKGFSHDIIASYAALKGLDPVIELPEEINEYFLSELKAPENYDDKLKLKTLRIKYGCSCGECIAGFLSPRMRYALSNFARDYIVEFKRQGYFNAAGSFLSDSARKKLRDEHPGMQEGYILICSYIGSLCAEGSKIPSVRNIMEYARGQQKHNQNENNMSVAVLGEFLRQGGTVAAVAKDLFKVTETYFEIAGCENDDEFSDPRLPVNRYLARQTGKGKGRETEVLSEKEDGGRELKLPRCANDREMAFVQRMCGY